MKAVGSEFPFFDDALVKRYADKIRATGKIDLSLYENTMSNAACVMQTAPAYSSA